MHPREIIVSLDHDETTTLLGELTAENRGLRVVVSKYVNAYGILPELGGPLPMPDAPIDAEPVVEAEAEPAPEG